MRSPGWQRRSVSPKPVPSRVGKSGADAGNDLPLSAEARDGHRAGSPPTAGTPTAATVSCGPPPAKIAQGDQTDVGVAQHVDDGRNLPLAPDQGRARQGQVMGSAGTRRAGHGAARSVGDEWQRCVPASCRTARYTLTRSSPSRVNQNGRRITATAGVFERKRRRSVSSPRHDCEPIVVGAPSARRNVGRAERAPLQRERPRCLTPGQVGQIRVLARTKSLR